MFTALYTRPAVLARHRTAPCAESRERFLEHCAEQGYCPSSLRKIAWILLVLSQNSHLRSSNGVTRQQIESAVDHRVHLIRRHNHLGHAASSRQMFIHIATAWCRFRKCLADPKIEQRPYSVYIDRFVAFMRDERGLSPVTIATFDQRVTNFLEAAWRPGSALNTLTVKDVDAYLAQKGKRGWKRASLHALASTLRSFFRYAEGQRWCHDIAAAIEAPRLFIGEGLPLGPTWEEVQQLMVYTAGNGAADIRNHAIMLLLAVYGLRRGEVARLRLDDVDWAGELLHVERPKQRCRQHYPLIASVGDAIVLYLQEVRPVCRHRTLFLALHAPHRPLSPGSITAIVHSRLAAAGITLPQRGAHCLRHACARHLLESGFSLKQIGDQLGHRNASTTLHYAKVDLAALREVAKLSLGGVL